MINITFYHFNTNPTFPLFLLYVRCKSGLTFVRRCINGDSIHYPQHMVLRRNLDKHHFLSFQYQPQISPVFTICKVQILIIITFYHFNINARFPQFLLHVYVRCKSGITFVQRSIDGDYNSYPQHVVLMRNLDKYHFLSFQYQPHISPFFTICKVQIWVNFCTEMYKWRFYSLPTTYGFKEKS